MKKRIFKIIILFFGCALAVYGAFVFFWEKNHHANELVIYGNVDVRQVDIGFRVYGRVDSMPFEEGDFVKKGSLMATIEQQPYSDQVHEAKANIEAIQTQLKNAEIILQRRLELVDGGGVSKENYDDALASRDIYQANLKRAIATLGVAETNLTNTKAYAPADGMILTRIREPGTVVRESEPVYTLSVLSPVWIRAYVSEPHLGEICPGMEAEVFTDTKDAPSYRGHIGFISPVAEFTPKTVETLELRTDLVYRLRVVVDNPDYRLKQGMPVTVKLYLKKNKNGSACNYPASS